MSRLRAVCRLVFERKCISQFIIFRSFSGPITHQVVKFQCNQIMCAWDTDSLSYFFCSCFKASFPRADIPNLGCRRSINQSSVRNDFVLDVRPVAAFQNKGSSKAQISHFWCPVKLWGWEKCLLKMSRLAWDRTFIVGLYSWRGLYCAVCESKDQVKRTAVKHMTARR